MENFNEGDETQAAREKKLPYLPPCRVCDSVASGFHYGVNTCEACKGFYRRSIARKTPYSKCTGNGNCDIILTNRNACASCRLEKCVAVGMSKEAIKTGRYTHKKRTLDTLEIKHVTPGSLPSSVAEPNIPDHHSPSVSTGESEEKLASLANEICQAYRKSFVDATYLNEHAEEINEIVKQMLSDRGMSEVTGVLYSPGHTPSNDEDHQQLAEFVAVAEKTIASLGDSDLSELDRLMEMPKYKHLATQLFELWLHRIDRLIRMFVHFVRKLPQFQTLPVSDQITLIKASRQEVSMLLMSAHYRAEWGSMIDYRQESGTITLIPNVILKILYMVDEDYPEGADHNHLFIRCMKQMMALDMKVENVSVLSAICVFSSDRDDLSPEVLSTISQIQETLTQVLLYTLKRSHSTDKHALPKFLMMLPSLRLLNEYNKNAMLSCRQKFRPTVPPLLQEIFPALLKKPTSEQDMNSTESS